jgi:hypothetical protein
MTTSEVPLSPFMIEYAVVEQHPEKPGQFRELLTTTDWDIARGTLAGLNMQFKMREQWTNTELPPTPHGVGRFTVVSRLVGAKWMHPEEVSALMHTLTQALGEWDAVRGFHSGDGK